MLQHGAFLKTNKFWLLVYRYCIDSQKIFFLLDRIKCQHLIFNLYSVFQSFEIVSTEKPLTVCWWWYCTGESSIRAYFRSVFVLFCV